VRGAKRDSLPGPFIKTFPQGKKTKKIDHTPATGLSSLHSLTYPSFPLTSTSSSLPLPPAPQLSPFF
jgi:hypothetical protein